MKLRIVSPEQLTRPEEPIVDVSLRPAGFDGDDVALFINNQRLFIIRQDGHVTAQCPRAEARYELQQLGFGFDKQGRLYISGVSHGTKHPAIPPTPTFPGETPF